MNSHEQTSFVKSKAYQLGFNYVGIAKAEFMKEEARRLEQWLYNSRQGKMSYLENHFDKRVDPTKLVPGAKTVISLIYNYYPSQFQLDSEAPKIAKYAYGEDYHFIIRDKLNEFLAILRDEIGEVDGRGFVDSAPVLERDWAKRAGVGWVGKNSLIINPKKGSYFFLAELIIDLDLVADHPIKDFCGTCTKCIDACPTDAIAEEGYVLDGSKCISYLTIELKDEIPNEFKDKMENWAFGCDICQEVCPWNRFSEPHHEPAFNPIEGMLEFTRKEWYEITEETFRRVFKKSALKRTKFAGLKRNLKFIKSD